MLNGIGHDYFSLLLHRDKRGPVALEKLVDDIHCDKERTINSFLCHSGSEDFLWGLVHLLGNKNSRVAGNAAYVLGTLAESDLGCYRVISLTNSKHPDSDRIMRDLSDMLLCEDAESVMNAAGTMGTLAESPEGRTWMLREACLPQTISHITKLLNNENLWTASNAALVLARLTIAEEGCEIVLKHPDVELILTNLIMSLGVDEAGRGMNAAFAIGRVSDIDTGRSKLLSLPDSEKMITSLSKMLGSTDQGASKNSCFALSCLATTSQGHHRLLKNIYSESVIQTLSELLSSEDGETGWFSAMTLRTLASHCEGCVRLREHSDVLPALQSVEKRTEVNSDLKEEVQQTLEILKKLDKPAAPTVEVDGCHKIDVSWEAMTTKSGLSIQYQLYQGSQLVYTGTKLSYTATDLAPHTQYAYRVRAFTQGDDSPMSDITSTVTQETVPGPPENFHVVATTTTQCKVTWDAPNEMNGVIKGYHVYNGKNLVEHTNELTSIISGLAPNTSYNIYVCASTVQGKGEQAEVCVTTAETGAHAPSKPEIIVRGRHELQVAWKPPVVPLGRISRYDLTSNGEVVYSGTDLHYTVHRLKPDTEYSFVVYAITSEGKCESKTTKKRTAKDGYDGDRAPLYQTPVRRDSVDTQADSKPTPAQMRQKRKSICGSLGMQPEVKSSSPKRASSAKARTVVITSKEPEKEPEIEPEKEGTPEPPAQEVAIRKQDVPPTDTTPLVEVPMPVVEPVSPPSVDETDRTSITPPLKSMKSPVPESDTPTITKQKSILKPTTCSVPERSTTALSNKTATTFGNSEQSSVDQPLPKPMRPDFTKFKPMKPSIVSNPSKVTKRAMRRPSIQSVGSDGVNEGQKTWKMKDSLVGGNTKQENEGKFMENNIVKSDDSTDLTKSFSNLHSGFFKLSASTTGSNQSRHLNSFIMDYDPLSSLTKAPANPARSNAMVHPPSTTKIGMRQNRRYAVERPVVSKTITANPSNLTKQLQPDFVKAEADRKHNTSKFIPMQYRTQPLNMPGQVSRQHTSFTFTQNKNPPMRSLESLTRSRTELTLGDPHKEYVSSNINTYMSGNASAVYEYQQKLMQQEDRLTSLQESHAEQIPDLKRQSTVLSMSHQKHNEPFMNRLTIGSSDRVH